jgi:TolB-like protein/class 3 adenylate cyclase/Flp pilus assembly protein TadD
MSTEVKKEIQLEIAHVLFIDTVGYSKLLIDEQRDLIDTLNHLVRDTGEFRSAEAAGKLIKIATGDGMVLVFYNRPEAPVECALQISRALKEHRELQLRMGVHSGPVSGVIDVNERPNVAGAGINVARRVMDCGDAGHILLSQHVADDLEQYGRWRPHLHDLGECESKHGVRVRVFNFYTNELGNPELPEKFRQVIPSKPAKKSTSLKWALIIAAGVVITAVSLFMFDRFRSIRLKSASAQAERSAFSLPIPEKSIGVLPFRNLSDEKENAYFADGVQGEILTDLAGVADLKVISQTSVMQYRSGVARNLREIGQQLGVAHLVEGSVQRAGNRVRVNAQLLDARTDRQLWAQTYDRNLADVFAIQSEIATAIAEQLQAKLSPGEKTVIQRPPTGDITAFDLYTRAKNLLLTSFSGDIRAKLLQAADLLNQAVARDPSFLQAYCQLAYAHDNLYLRGFDHTPARLALAEAAIQAAFRLRPDAGEAHLAQAENLYRGYFDYDGALAELEIARETLPNEPRVFELQGYIERRQGRWEKSTRNLERAVDLDPRNPNVVGLLQQIGAGYELLRRYAEETAALDRALAVEPNNVDTKVSRAAVDFNWKGDTRPLHQTLDLIRATNPGAMPSIASDWLICALAERDAGAARNALVALGENPLINYAVHLNRSVIEGVLARMTKDEGRARLAFTAARAEQEKTVQAQPNYGPALCALGLIDAGLGRKEEALREGRRAVELIPAEKDAVFGPLMVEYLAMIAAWVGDKNLSCEQLAIAVRPPSTVSYGQLKLMPFWDPLRGDPRFEKLVEEAKQPIAIK